MLAPFRKDAGQLAATERVREWTRERFRLGEDAAILVSEVACALPGCPPLETVVAFWIGEERYRFKLFKRIDEVVYDDLPFAWLKDSLADSQAIVCECC
jgi:hypothetical protein